MNKKVIFFIVVLTTVSIFTHVAAQSFNFVSPSGDTLFFNVVNNGAHVAKSSKYSSFVGHVIIPETVSYNGNAYNVTGIANTAFTNCPGITAVTIPQYITMIGSSSFWNCDNLTTVYYNATNCTSSDCPFTTNAWTTGRYSNIETVVIGDNVQNIPDDLFGGCNHLVSVNIPSSVTHIGTAFWGCSELSHINIPESVIQIKEEAFQNSGLTSLTIPRSVTMIGYHAFANCNSLTTVNYNAINCSYICNTSYSGNGGLFENCENLTTVTMGEDVQYLSSYTFYNCTGLTTVTMGDNIPFIGNSTFYGCNNLTSIHLSESVKHIYSDAFRNCTSLISITLPDSLTQIDHNAFNACNNLAEIYSHAHIAPTLGSNVFSAPTDIPVYIPCGSEASYSARWTYFSNFIEDTTLSYILVVMSNDDNMGYTEIVAEPTCSNPTAVIRATAATGYQFVGWQDGNRDNPRTVNVLFDTTFIAYFDISNGIDNTVTGDIMVSVKDAKICIDGAMGLDISIYDYLGRKLAERKNASETEFVFPVNHCGIYIVKIGELPTRKVVVTY